MEEFKDLLKAKREECDPDEANNNMPERNFSLDDILDLEKKELDSLELLGKRLLMQLLWKEFLNLVKRGLVRLIFSFLLKTSRKVKRN